MAKKLIKTKKAAYMTKLAFQREVQLYFRAFGGSLIAKMALI